MKECTRSGGRRDSGISLNSASRRPERGQNNMRSAYLDGEELTDRPALHRSLSEQLAFPSWYGNNLDALYDLLSTEPEPVRVVICNSAAAAEALGDYWGRFLDVLADTAAEVCTSETQEP